MGTEGTIYLGIDGGGTRCRARIEDENGRVLGEASSGPATTRIGFEKAWRSIMEATEAAAAQAGLTREDFARIAPSDGCFACCYAWRHLAQHSHWLKAVASAACLETSNSDEVVRGGGMARRMAIKFRDEAGISFKQQPSNVEHMAADVAHAHLLLEVIDHHVTTDADRQFVLDGAQESWAIDRVWKGQLAEAIAAVPG